MSFQRFARARIVARIAVAASGLAGVAHASASDTATYVIHAFATENTASSPHDGVILGSDGAFYGTSYWGGAGGVGTVFRVAPDGTEAILHNFSPPDPNSGTNADGMEPNARLILGKDGNVYGVTSSAGPGACGTLFRISPAGNFAVVYAFTGREFGGPEAALVADASGNLYGIGCSGNNDIFFRYSIDTGALTPLHTFAEVEDSLYNGLAFASDGNLYGSSNRGGANGVGNIFRLTPNGTYTELHVFSRDANGFYPVTVPAQGADGNLYGIVPGGGAQSNGAVYRIGLDGSGYELVHSFDPYNDTTKTNIDGDQSYFNENRDLTRGSDGSLYGSLAVGGVFASGTNFRIAPDGTYNVIANSDLNLIGNPQDGKLALDSNGNLYGVTGSGNSNGGTLFKLVPHSTTSANISLSAAGVTRYHPLKISWTSANASSCKLLGDLPWYLKSNVALNGSKTWYPGKRGRAVIGIQCATPDGGVVNSAAAVTVN